MTLVGIPFILKNAEMNRGLSAARDGATKGAAVRGLGFSSSGGNEAGQIKIINMTVSYNSTVGDKDRYTLRFFVSIPDEIDSTSACNTIKRQALSHINKSLYGGWSSSFSDIEGSYYIFNVRCKNIN